MSDMCLYENICAGLQVSGADPGGGLGGLQPPVLSPAPVKEHGKRTWSRAKSLRD